MIGKIITIFIIIVSIKGCTILRYSEELLTLKMVGESQKEIYEDMKKQESLFYVLLGDIKSNNLIQGISRQEIIDTYGEPVLVWEVKGDSEIKKKLLYRHPTDYFSSPRIYLYFNENNILLYWEIKE